MGIFSLLIAALISFAACAFSGCFLIPYLHKLHFGQTILDIGPKWHEKKQGTPTMGGIMIFFGTILGLAFAVAYSLVFSENGNVLIASTGMQRLISGFCLALGMGAIGFVDDYIKIVKKRNLGLTARQKTIFQFFVAACYLAGLYFSGLTTTWLPFIGNFSVVSGAGILFWPISLFFIYGFTNAVNLTDGVDGLASTVTMVVSCAFMVLGSYFLADTTSVFAAAIGGACTGFLVWNSHPAKVFMGDTGSMFLGGAVVAMSYGINKPVILILVGIVYLCEAFSVILQVLFFKKTGKRLFKMSPIHHHFELCGWSEEKIVIVFSFVTVLFSVGAAALAVFA